MTLWIAQRGLRGLSWPWRQSARSVESDRLLNLHRGSGSVATELDDDRCKHPPMAIIAQAGLRKCSSDSNNIVRSRTFR